MVTFSLFFEIFCNIRVQGFILNGINPKTKGGPNTMHKCKSGKNFVLVNNDISKLVYDIKLEEGVQGVENVMNNNSFISSA